MENITIKLANGLETSFILQPDGQRPACFIFGVRKSGSSIFNSVCESLSIPNGYHYVDVAGKFFEKNIKLDSWINDIDVNRLIKCGNLYGGFRDFPHIFESSPLFIDGLKVLLVRDPRDALISEYFSNAYSHVIPVKEDGRDEVTKQMSEMRTSALKNDVTSFVLSMAPAMNATLLKYKSLAHDRKCIVLKYEDIILDKSKLISKVCEHFGWTCSDERRKRIIGWADVFPSIENEYAFVRRVLPGDHREKLSLDTICRLEVMLRQSMDLFGY